MNAAVQVSVIIVSYNVQDFLDLCLDAVFKSLSNVTHEVFVVDNASKDGSVALVQSKYPQVKLLDNTDNKGFSKANNQALALSQGKYVHFLNPDTIIPEDFYDKTIAYLNAHPQVGALGPRIIDADGNYAPDSKKSFPSFWVSVAKVTGLSKMFPKSPLFNKYYAAHIGEYETATVDILSGCCMLVNKSNLMQSGGGFDEAYFMYCEDVDMCHRLSLQGYNNVYFPEVTIVHYKGESTRKLTISYMKIFYDAHALFVAKYYPKKLGILFNAALKSVLVLRNVFNVLKYVFAILKIYLLDALIILGSLLLFRYYWFTEIHNLALASLSYMKTIPLFLAVWMISLFLNGAYDKPYSLFRTGRGMLWGTIFVLVIYALLPFELRQSRAVVVFSGILSTVLLLFSRTFFAQIGLIHLVPRGKNDFKSIIAAQHHEWNDVVRMLKATQYRLTILGRIGDAPSAQQQETEERYLGHVSEFKQIQQVLSVNEVIFSAAHMSYKEILATMQLCKDRCTYKIIPENSPYIISSQSLQNDMDIYGLSNYNIGTASNKRNKRIIDVLLSLMVLLSFPIWLLSNKKVILAHAWSVFKGQKTWIGYSDVVNEGENAVLPKLKLGVFPPYVYAENGVIPPTVLSKINMKYAKEYSVIDDLQYFLKNVRNL